MCTKLRKPALNDNFSKDFKEQVYLCDSEAGILRRRLATSRPLGEVAFFGREAADRERRGRERSTCLDCKVFIRISRQNDGEWRDSHLGFQVSFASP